ncbi:unnamed protein product [marine sediment metagenome]|uniref:Uncharacterized protein n=1 Tax=marine sediment metagenome TaxID=412755 RepID=X1HPF3_9ZZZZ
MQCRNCEFLSDPEVIGGKDDYPSVRCKLGLWDKQNKEGVPQWYSYGESQLNRGPVKRLGAACSRGKQKERKKAGK